MLDNIERALEERIQAFAGEPLVAWWDNPFAPTKGVAYLKTDITGRAVRSMALGASAPELWEGVLQLTVAQPTAEGRAGGRVRVDALRAHFPRGLTLNKNGVQVTIMERSVQPSYPAIDWINYPLLITWICEEIHA